VILYPRLLLPPLSALQGESAATALNAGCDGIGEANQSDAIDDFTALSETSPYEFAVVDTALQDKSSVSFFFLGDIPFDKPRRLT
jgi:hypothetical protein